MIWLIYMHNLWYTNYWADVFKLTAENEITEHIPYKAITCMHHNA